MSTTKKSEQEELARIEQAIASHEGLRGLFPDAVIDSSLLPLRERRQALHASVGRALEAVTPEGGVEARGRSVAVGRDLTAGVLITGHVDGNVYVGPEASTAEDAILAYCEVMKARWTHLPLRAVDITASDPTGRPQPVELAAVYVDLDAKASSASSLVGAGGRRRDQMGIEGPGPLRVIEILANNRCCVLLGDPGSGKSTFLSYVGLCLASARIEPQAGWSRPLEGWDRATAGLLPVHVILRDFAAVLPDKGRVEPSHLWSFIVGRLVAENLQAAVDPVHFALQTGGALVLLDGLDEIPSLVTQERVRDAVEVFSRRYEKSDVLVTCRTLSYQSAACRLEGIPSYELAPFDRSKIDAFIAAWYKELVRRGVVPAKEARELAKDLREAVRRPDLLEISSNPLLLTVMALIHAHNVRLPEARALLYEETVDLLLWRWEDQRTRRFRTLLEQAGAREIDFKKILWALAFEAHGLSQVGMRGGLADLQQWRIIDVLARLHPERSLDWARAMIEAMKLRAGLLLERLPEVYTFPHLTFQEYMAGAHLSIDGEFATRAMELSRQGASSREVVLFAVGRLVHLMGDTDRPLALLGELCPSQGSSSDQGWRDAWIAGEVLAEVGTHRLAGKQLGREMIGRVRGRLVDLMRGEKLESVERARAGNALGRVGDPRFHGERWYLPAEDLLGFVEVPRGAFLMGSDPATDHAADEDEKPQHLVEVPSFYMMRYPVTVEQFGAFVADSGHAIAHEDALRGKATHPVVWVNLDDAWAYADWLTEKLKRSELTPEPLAQLLRDEARIWRVVVPSEAEWEKAARGIDGKIYVWGDAADPGGGNYRDTKVRDTSPVGCFKAGASRPYGCEDMSGNVWELTRTLWQRDVDSVFRYPYVASDGREVRRAPVELQRVVRGGSFMNRHTRVRCAFRAPNEGVRGTVGFRVAISSQDSSR